MAHMVLSVLYLAENLGCLAVLVRAKYYRMWALLTAQVAVTCWQIGALLLVDSTDRTMAIRIWFPGDLLLVIVSAAAVLEVLWRSLRGFPMANKLGVCVYSCVALHFSGLSMRWLMGLPSHADWLAQYRADRQMANLSIATLSIIAAGVAHSFNRKHDPRCVRFHGTIISVLSCGHVLLSDMSRWSESHTAYRALECACCLGWMINANLQGKERNWLHRSTAASAGVRSIPLGRTLPLPAERIVAPVVRSGFGSHRWTGPVVSSPPVVPAGTR